MNKLSLSESDLVWRDSYSIGVAALDEQHQRLMDILRRLERFRRTGGSVLGRWLRQDDLARLLGELDEYAAYHFLTEENLMRTHLPSDRAMVEHVTAHRHYWQELKKFHHDYEGEGGNGAPEVSDALFDFLCDCWLTHIHQTDRALGRALNEQGIA